MSGVGARRSALPHPGQRWNLLLHGVGAPARSLEPGEGALWIQPDLLGAVLDIATERRPGLSSDDGNRSDVDLVLPALAERGLTATFFILAGRLNRPGSLSEAAVRELRDAGMHIGTHGMDHIPWRRLDPQTARREFVDARNRLEDVVQAPIRYAACPFGRYDRQVLARLKRQDYERVYTSDGWPAKPDVWLQPRYSVRGADTEASIRARLDGRRDLRSRALSTSKGLWKRLR